MSTKKFVDQYTPEVLKETVYLHVTATTGGYSNRIQGVSVRKLAKSLDAAVTPGDYIVKLDIAVPKQFFEDAMPSARITLESGQVVPIDVTPVDVDESEEAS